VFLDKFILAQLVKKFPAFKEPEGSLPCSQKPNIRHYLSHLNPVYSSFLEDPIYQAVSSLEVFRPNVIYILTSMRATCSAYPVFLDLIIPTILNEEYKR
jgi:hypothetical protein